jgi:hypothetical protein
MTLLRILVGACLAISSPVFAQSTDCVGSIKGHSAVFYIENRIGEEPLTWSKRTSPIGYVEYMWSVTPGTLRQDGTLGASDMWFGLVVAKREGAVESTGTLDDLFAAGTPVLVRNENERDWDARIRIGRFREGIVIGINHPETFRKVFGGRPTGARIEAYLHAVNRRHSCIVSIEYE